MSYNLTLKKAPCFTLRNQNDDLISNETHIGNFTIIFFYPKDLTPGCSMEAKNFSDMKDQFLSINTHILGVSKDSVIKHQTFCKKLSLDINLLSDIDGHMCNDYFVWSEKKNYGKTYMGIVRSTFIIDPDGVIIKEWRNVRVKNHVDTVYKYLLDYQKDKNNVK